MSKTTYPGIDYAWHSGANTDKETGIRYGMISSHSISPEALDEVYRGRDLGFEEAERELKARLKVALSDYYSDSSWDGKPSRLGVAVAAAFDSLDGWADGIESHGPFLLKREGYCVQTSDLDLWVFRSPFYTHAQFCSPCVPGAGNLDSPCEDGPKTYCLGHDWFEDGKAPYRVFSVATDEEVFA